MKPKNKKQDGLLSEQKDKRIIKYLSIILILFSIGLYYNTTFNYFSFDDGFVNIENEIQAKGLAGIPEIFTTPYSSLDGKSLGYRPITRMTFAIEYQFTANSKFNPAISHIINTLLYALSILLLFSVLRRIFRNYNPWFIFLALLLFTSHPLHTEVVASLKNRDILLNFIFSFIAIKMFLKWADFKNNKYLIFGIISYFMALLSKETAIAQLAVFPLVLYYFTDMPLKKILYFAGGLFALIIITFGIPVLLLLPPVERSYRFFENPLAFEDNFFNVLATGFYGLGFYLKMLAFPYPLRYYYGYDVIPVVSSANIWAILSFLVYAAMAVYSIMNIKKKTFLSFIFLYFIINISMYANIVAYVPGIVGDRFTYFPSLAFVLFFVWLLYKIFGVNPELKSQNIYKTVIISLIVIVFSGGYTYYTHIRNTNWRTEYRLYNSDMPVLWNSAKANQMFAQKQLERVNIELHKKVNIYKYLSNMISLADKHFSRAVEVDSSMYASWIGLGNIYSRIHGNQANIRYFSYMNKGDTLKAEEEIVNAHKYFNKAHYYFNKALEIKPDYDEAIFNIGYTYELEGKFDSAVAYYQRGIAIQGERVNTLSKLANAYFLNNQFDEALKANEKIKEINPKTSIPYVNMGNYYIKFGDTLQGIKYYEDAAKLDAQVEVYNFLAVYYQKHDKKKFEYYRDKSRELRKKQQ